MSEKKAIITGATGMVGGCTLRICLENPHVSLVTAIGRNRTGINDARLREVVVDDFTDLQFETLNLGWNNEGKLRCYIEKYQKTRINYLCVQLSMLLIQHEEDEPRTEERRQKLRFYL